MSSHTPVAWKCPDCGALNSPDRIDCGGCGLVIPEGPADD